MAKDANFSSAQKFLKTLALFTVFLALLFFTIRNPSLVLSQSSGDKPSGWWDADWAYRNNIEITNQTKTPLNKNYTIDFVIDKNRFGNNASPVLADLRLVYKGTEIPFVIENQDEKAKETTLWFNLEKALPPESKDANYWLYYGNPGATAANFTLFDLLPFYEDFSSGKLDAAKWEAEKEIDYSIRKDNAGKSSLVINSLKDGKDNDWNNRTIKIKNIPPLQGFAIECDILYGDTAGYIEAFYLNVKLTSPVKINDELKNRLNKLVVSLGDDDWETRESAQNALIKIGEPSLESLAKTLKETSDPEVRMRINYILKQINESLKSREITLGINDSWNMYTGDIYAVIAGEQKVNCKYGVLPAEPAIYKASLFHETDGTTTIKINNRKITGKITGELKDMSLLINHYAPYKFYPLECKRLLVREYINPPPKIMIGERVENKK
ncbi:MAG: DUF2341 domain-containing protein [Planctomycetes bacterium]|nr:DUF2341 domain-containing protein [Planctomycetota bacterium]